MKNLIINHSKTNKTFPKKKKKKKKNEICNSFNMYVWYFLLKKQFKKHNNDVAKI